MTTERAVPAPSPSAWTDAIGAALSQIDARLLAIGAAALILLAGWILALIIRALVRRLSRQANRLLDRVFQRSAQPGVRTSQGALALLGEVAFWITLLIAAALAAQVAGFVAVAGWLNEVVAHLPNLAAGAAIIVAGFLISVVIGEQVAAAARNAGARQGDLIGRFAQGAIFVAALIIGLGQIGIDVTLLIALAVVVTGATLISFAIAFGLGAREFVADVIAARSLRRQLRPGMNIRIGAYEGEILEITATHIAIDTPHGKAMTPARLAAADIIVVLDSLTAEPPDG